MWRKHWEVVGGECGKVCWVVGGGRVSGKKWGRYGKVCWGVEKAA